jgi:ABC-type transport system involved in cytochrome bd biosynthesis fused ATPase/permease subunit
MSMPTYPRPSGSWGPAIGVAFGLALIGIPVSACGLFANIMLMMTGLFVFPPAWLVVFAVPTMLLTAAWLFLRQGEQHPERFRIGMGVLASPAIVMLVLACAALFFGGLKLFLRLTIS